MAFHNFRFDASEGRLRRLQLREDIDAVPIFLDHGRNASNLPRGSVEPNENRAMIRVLVLHRARGPSTSGRPRAGIRGGRLHQITPI